MGVRKIGPSWWTDFRSEGKRIRKKSPENSRSGARAYELLLQGRLARGESIEPSEPKKKVFFTDFAEKWHEIYVMTNTKPSVQRNYRMVLDRHLKVYFKKDELDGINIQMIEGYKALKLKEGLSPKTINNHLAVLKGVLTTSVEWGSLDVAPKITWLKVPPQKFDFLTSEESSLLLASTQESNLGAMIHCGLRTGMRMGEMLALRWEDIDFHSSTVTVSRNIVRGIVGSPKNNKVRHIPLSEDLGMRLLGFPEKKGYVFSDLEEHVTRGMAWRAIQTACKRIQMRPIGWHVLRHTFASQLAMGGVSVRAIQEMLGHSDLKTTMRYAHLSPSSLHDSVSILCRQEIEAMQRLGQPVVNEEEISTEMR